MHFRRAALKSDAYENGNKKINILMLHLSESRLSVGWCTRFIESRITTAYLQGKHPMEVYNIYAMIPPHSLMKTHIIFLPHKKLLCSVTSKWKFFYSRMIYIIWRFYMSVCNTKASSFILQMSLQGMLKFQNTIQTHQTLKSTRIEWTVLYFVYRFPFVPTH